MVNQTFDEEESKTLGTSINPFQLTEERMLVERILAGSEADIVFFLTRLCMPVFIGVIERSQQLRWVTPEELCSDIYLHLSENNWHRLRKFEFRCSIKTWIWTVCLHMLYRRYRREVRHFRDAVAFDLVENNLPSDEVMGDLNHLVFRTGSEDLVVDPLSVTPFVQEAIERVKNKYYRDLLEMRGLQDLSSRETADSLGRSSCAIDQGYCRAKKELKKILRNQQE